MSRKLTTSVGGSVGLAVLLILWTLYNASGPTIPPVIDIGHGDGGAIRQNEFLFCHWNVENLFDDQDDNRQGPGDKEYDRLFAQDPDLLRKKLAKLTDALLKMNAGKGPDILAVVEIEGVRAADLLRVALNERLADRSLHYQNLLAKDIAGGRHIAPAIITRLPVVKDRTRTHGNRQRILEGRVVVNKHELVIFASHWTSRLQDGDKGRRSYADKIYGAGNAMFKSDRAVDFLVAGDFNDDPDDDSLTQNLHAVGDARAVQGSDSLKLFNLMAGKDPASFGTHYYRKWHVFDQVVVSPGMLDNKGWTCEPESIRVTNNLHKASDKQKRPWRFGGEKEKGERGYSDHFPVTVRLRVEK